MVSSKPFTVGNRQPWTTLATQETRPSQETNISEADKITKAQELRDFIIEIAADVHQLEKFYNVNLSATRVQRLGEYVSQHATALFTHFAPFDDLTQDAKVDFLLIHAWIFNKLRTLRTEWTQLSDLKPLLGDWVPGLVDLCERRQKVVPTEGKYAGQVLSDAIKAVDALSTEIQKGKFKMEDNRFGAYRAALQLEDLGKRLTEWYEFYSGYDPLFTWWTSKPWHDFSQKLVSFVAVIRQYLVGIKPGDDDAIVGQPISKEGIDAELLTEFIAYSPEEIIAIGEKQYKWCEKEAIKASQEMGFGDDWRKAQEKVKNMYVEPGQQTNMVHELAQEAVDYVEKYDMVTLPEIAKECWRTFMMSPERQKVNPFFLGGTSIIVSYPTDTMSHEDKLMVMRGNNRPFSRSTVFHELLPGHHLQYHYMARSKQHRNMFQTPFWIEGWSFYWELILWDRGFPGTPENRLGMLFWHMHRCARIVFSLNFHLGKWTPQQCIDYLVEKVGHERATAEGEVRRSFNGEYGALYQAGYMLGALQLYALRKEIVDAGEMTEKQFHDRVMKENNMPIELLRALLKGGKLEVRQKPSWKFYDL
ncbi:uncharacterized protein MYCFIDRAFT_58864 [Pseudocercospora fijiensis CIRAD86]|uniref:X-Pro dipeptidyl-peptidase n=1 Tax=Pseudocercospora fijiensis (strain CIRAD86) TaxID=383855 RepID=M3AV05_PSEFD|nr:uncharacterized protein MYCFIDRAFT_58864 [Pseudocercospora fijiensis CIRAD86]EME81317.1 hypothetical protein MYCFIDRAFT_58864 [Pseudocercospora fijiensis CIRAD86]